MKLKIVSFAQRDSLWSNILLGYNTSIYTIGGYGCLITCLASYLKSLDTQETPATVNKRLIDNQGFQSGTGNFIWTKSTVLGLTQTYLSPYYSNLVTDQGVQKAKDLLDQGYPLLTEVDFNPATYGEEMHFVLLCGYEGDVFYCMDPWQGNVVTLDNYGGFKRGVLQFRAYDKILAKQDVESIPSDQALQECLSQHTILVDKCNQKDNLIKELQGQLSGAQDEIKAHKTDLEDIANLLKNNVTPDKPSIIGAISTLISEEDQLTQTLKINEQLKNDKAVLENDISTKNLKIEGLTQANEQQVTMLEQLRKDKEALENKLAQLGTVQALTVIAKLPFGLFLCNRKGE